MSVATLWAIQKKKRIYLLIPIFFFSLISGLRYGVGIVYRIVMGLIYSFIKGCVLMDFRSFKGYKKGIIAGYKYIRSDEYHRIPKVC